MAKKKNSKSIGQLAPPPDALAAIYLFANHATTAVRTPSGIVHKAVALESLKLAFSGIELATGLLPTNTLFYEGGSAPRIGVYAPPRLYDLRYAAHNTVKERRLRIPMPGFVFVGHGRDCYLYAVAGSDYPSEETELFYPPVPNVYTKDNRVCPGSVPFPECNGQMVWAMFDVVFSSFFTNHMAPGRCQSYPKDVLKLWRKLAAAKRDVFPDDELVTVEKTLGDLIGSGVWDVA